MLRKRKGGGAEVFVGAERRGAEGFIAEVFAGAKQQRIQEQIHPYNRKVTKNKFQLN